MKKIYTPSCMSNKENVRFENITTNGHSLFSMELFIKNLKHFGGRRWLLIAKAEKYKYRLNESRIAYPVDKLHPTDICYKNSLVLVETILFIFDRYY